MSAIRALLLLAALVTGPAHALTLSGTVYGSGSPLANATIALIDAASSTQLQQGTSNGTGFYTFTLPPGTYNLQVAPPAGSIYAPAAVNGIVVSATNVVQDILLIPVPRTLSGTLRGHGGTPLANAEVYIRASGSNSVSFTRSNAQGQYSFGVSEGGSYCMGVDYGRDYGTADFTVPRSINWGGCPNAYFTITGDRVNDFDFPFSVLSGRTTDSNGAAVPGVGMAFTGGGTWVQPGTGHVYSIGVSWSSGDSVVSNASGEYTIKVPSGGPYSVRLTPGSGVAHVVTTFSNVSVPADLVRDFAFPPSRVLSGTLRGHGGALLGNAEVYVRAAGNNTVSTTRSNAQGQYSIGVAEGGSYCMGVNYGRDYGTADFTVPRSINWGGCPNAYFTISGDRVNDFNFSFNVLSGRTTDSNGAAVSGVGMAFTGGGTWVQPGTGHVYSLGVSWSSGDSVASNASGEYTIKVPSGLYSVKLTPSSGVAHVTTTFSNVSVTSDLVRDFAFPPSRVLSGTLRGHANAPLANAEVYVRSAGNNTISTTRSSPQGQYSIGVADGGSYCMGVNYGRDYGTVDFTVPRAINWGGCPNAYFTISGDRVNDFTFPFTVLSGKTTDANGVPVAGVGISMSAGLTWVQPGSGHAYSVIVSSTAGPAATSTAGGDYLVKVPAGGPYSVLVTPPPASGFTLTSLANYSLAVDTLLGVFLDLPDTRAPTILSGPFANDVTLDRAVVAWLTNESSSGSVVVNGNTFTEPGPPRTAHSIAVSGLSPSTPYLAQVSSTDAAGNGPVAASVSFTTRSLPDTAPPVFIEGPVVTGVTHQGAIIEWSTSEPASALVEFGVGAPFGSSVVSGALLTHHRVEITGLAASTTYQVRTAATDAVGNGPSQSAVLVFATLATPDLAAPAIIGKPLAVDVTASAATISWTTDEPATSGVSWNDGAGYGLVSDPALVTLHTVRITGLAAGTTYAVTASSTDESGNGPALSAISFDTLPATDTFPPVITCGPTAVNVRQRSAAIQWCTGEASDSRVIFGTSPSQLTESRSLASLSTSHLVTLTGLAAATTYHYRADSRDPSGNASAPGPTLSFTTPAVLTPGVEFAQAPAVLYLGDTKITISWTTDAPADATLECTPSGGGETRRVSRATRETQHQLTISNLQPDVAYTCRARSIDIDGNVVEQ